MTRTPVRVRLKIIQSPKEIITDIIEQERMRGKNRTKSAMNQVVRAAEGLNVEFSGKIWLYIIENSLKFCIAHHKKIPEKGYL
jgi:hypothetical protein